MRDINLVITIEPKTFHFYLPKNAGISLKHEIDSVVKHNELLANHAIKREVRQLLSKYKRGDDIHEYGKQ